MNMLRNSLNLSPTLVQWLAASGYDYQTDAISATALIKSTREIVLANRLNRGEGEYMGVPVQKQPLELHTLFKSRVGQTLHDSLEAASMEGFSSLIEQTNPEFYAEFCAYSGNELSKFSQEKRSSKEINGHKITGKYDFVLLGRLYDYKTKGVWAAKKTDHWEYQIQGSIYRWLNPEVILDDTATFIEIYLDWSEARAKNDPTYPQSFENHVQVSLWSLEETEAWILNKLSEIQKSENMPEHELPLCTDKELWVSESEFKYYSRAGLSRASKNFKNDYVAAQLHLSKEGKGFVEEVKGTASKCHYCPVFSVCTQKDQLIREGRLY